MARLRDTVSIQSVDGDYEIDQFTGVRITNDLTQPSEVSVELGDDATWPSFQDTIKIGHQYKVFVNGRLRLTGRLEQRDVPTDSMAATTTRFTIRTKLADASYASADSFTRVKNTSIKDFILMLYHPLGFTEDDFIFSADTARDLLTGRTTASGTTRVDLDPIKIDSAKVSPPETVFSAADRHLRRHGLMHWDSPDGRIVIGAPDDAHDPLYFLRYSRSGDVRANNVLMATRSQDVSGIPSAVVVYGVNGTRGGAKKRVVAMTKNDTVYEAGIYRPIVVQDDGIKTQALAERAAARELSARSKAEDNIVAEMDGLSYWDGVGSIPWGTDTVCSVDSDVANISRGAYYIHRVVLSRTVMDGDKTNITALKRGIWKL
jgi:prophage tail gpP-like protein